MKKRWFLLLTLLLALPLLVACGGGDDEEGDDNGGDELSAAQVQDAMQAMFAEGNLEPMKAITCETEQPTEEDVTSMNEIVGEGIEIAVSCTRNEAVMDCTMSIPVEGADPMELPTSFNIVDEKLCGAINQAQ